MLRRDGQTVERELEKMLFANRRILIVSGLLLLFVVFCVISASFSRDKTQVSSTSTIPKEEPNQDLLPETRPSIVTQASNTDVQEFALSGTVTNTSGDFIPGALITVNSSENLTCTTDGAGGFRIFVPIGASKYELAAEKAGYVKKTAYADVTRESCPPVHIVLESFCRISGRIVYADGTPVQHATIRAEHGIKETADGAQRGLSSMSEASDEQGCFEIPRLTSGLCRLYVEERLMAEEMFRVGGMGQQVPRGAAAELVLAKEQKVENLLLTLPEQEKDEIITGVVQTPNGRPIQGARVWSQTGTGTNAISGKALALTDEQGRFRIDAIGTYDRTRGQNYPLVVFSEKKGFVTSRVPNVLPSAKDVIITMMPSTTGKITGIVLDRQTRTPVANAQVTPWQVATTWGDRVRQDFSAILNGGDIGTVTTDDSGEFVLKDVFLGEATVEVMHEDYGVSLHHTGSTSSSSKRVELLLDRPGYLNLEVSATGNLDADSNFTCHYFILPLGMLDWEDERTYQFTYAANGVSDQPIHESNTASMRYAYNIRRKFKKGAWRLTQEKKWVGRIPMPPGEYAVRIFGRIKGRNPLGSTPRYRVSQRVFIQPGGEETLQFSLGGASSITGQIGVEEGKKACLVLLHGQTSLPDIPFSAGAYWEESITHFLNSSCESFEMTTNAKYEFRLGQYVFPALAPGNYALGVYQYDPESRETRLIREQSITVDTDARYDLDLP
jgi:carboxypeptidase family protein